MRKKLFAILMSAMMMVTFMPAMAFAATHTFVQTGWAANYSKAVGYLDGATTTTELNTERTFQDNGEVKAQLTAASAGITGALTVTGKTASVKTTVYYYDLDNAEGWFKIDERTDVTGSMTADEYEDMLLVGVKFYQPDYTVGYDATKKEAQAKTIYNTNINGYNATFTQPAYDRTNFAEQKFENLPIKFGKDGTDVDLSANDPDAVGTLPKASFTVRAREAQATEVKSEWFFFDSVATDNAFAAKRKYDGAEHTIVMGNIPGITVAYEQHDDATGKWNAVSAPTFKNVGLYEFRATVTDAKKDTDTQPLTVRVTPARITVSLKDGSIFEGTAVDAWDYFAIEENEGTYTEKAVKKAIAADKEGLMTAFKKLYTVTATAGNAATTAFVSNFRVAAVYDIKAVEATLGTDDKKAYDASPMTGDFAVLNNYVVSESLADKTLYVVVGQDNELDFLGNASMKKTVHVKNAKAVKKAAVRHIKAEALSGTAVTFKKMSGNSKIAVAADGTMTIKKGLKKGTYKVVVKATAAAGNGYKRLTAKATYTVKVVK